MATNKRRVSPAPALSFTGDPVPLNLNEYVNTSFVQPEAPAAPEPEGRTVLGTMKDVGISAIKSAIAVPELAVGMANLVTGGAAGQMVEQAGVRFKDAKAMLDEGYSAPQKEAFRRVQAAEGLGDTFMEALSNPSVIGHSIIESLAPMGAGGALARGAMAVAPKIAPVVAAAGGEGAVMAGSAAEQIRQQTADGRLTAGQAGLAAATGVVGAGFGLLGGKVAGGAPTLGKAVSDMGFPRVGERIAKGLGVTDVDTLLAGAAKASPAAQKALTRRVLEGAVSEGVLEELPQSVSEQVLQNMALNKPLDEGLDQAAVLGLLSGSAMGGGANLLAGRAPTPQTEPPPPAPPPVAPPLAAVSPLDPTKPAGPLTRAANVAAATTLTGQTGADLLAIPDNPLLAGARVREEDRRQEDLSDKAMARLEQLAADDLQALNAARFEGQSKPVARATAAPAAMKNVAPEVDPGDIYPPEPGDILNPKGEPFKNKAAALTASKKFGGQVVQVMEGWAVRGGNKESANVGTTASAATVAAGNGGQLGADAAGGQRNRGRDDAGAGGGAGDAAPAAARRSQPGEPVRTAGLANPALTKEQNAATRPAPQGQAPRAETPAATGGDEAGTPAKPAAAGPAAVVPAGVTLFRGEPATGRKETVGGARFMSPDRKVAEMYAGKDGKISEESHSFKNLLDAPNWVAAKEKLGLGKQNTMADLVDAARDAGHDGVSFSTTNGREYIVIGKNEPATPKTGDTITIDGKPAAQVEGGGVEPTDYLAELFGSQEQRDAAQAKYVAVQDNRKAAVQRIRDEIARQKERATAEYADWSGRKYKANKTQVDLQGDGPSNQASMSIGAINEGRRRNAMDALAKELTELDKLAAAAETESGAEKILANLTTLRAKAAEAVKSGNWPGSTEDSMFESMLLEALKFRGPAGKGNVTSNGLSKAMLAAISGEATNRPAPAAASPKTGDTITVDGKPAEVVGQTIGGVKVQVEGEDAPRVVPKKAAKTASKEDLDHLFGVDQKRAKALDRIAKGTAYFGKESKAREYIKANGLSDTHEAVKSPTGANKWDVVAKKAEPAAQSQAPASAPTTDKGPHFASGVSDFKAGKPRVLPSYFTKPGDKNSKDWYRGWDAANAAAPVAEPAKPADTQRITTDKAEMRPYRKPDGSVGYEAVPIVEAAPAGVVKVPKAVDDALTADMSKQQARMKRLRSAAEADGQSLEEKKAALLKATAAEATLRRMRTTRFDAEDAAVAAVAAGDLAPFAVHADIFPSAAQALGVFMGKNDELDAEMQAYEAGLTAQTRADDRAKVAAAAPAPAPKPDPLTEQEKAAKAKMLGAAAKLATLLSKNTRANITPEQEQQMLPIVIELFEGAMELGYVKFKQAARYVREFIAQAIDQDAADSIPMDTLQGAYIATARRHADKDITPKKDVISVDTIADLDEPATNQPQNEVENAGPTADTAGKDIPNDRATDDATREGALDQVAPGENGAAPEDGTLFGGNAGGGQAGSGANGAAAGGRVPGARGGRGGAGRARTPATGGRRRAGAVGARGTGPDGSQLSAFDEGLDPEQASAPNIGAQNYRITEADRLGQGGEVQKFNDNIAAIRVLKDLDAEQRRATPGEQRALARYVGWGGLPSAFPNPKTGAFKDGWDARGKELRELLDDRSYDAAKRSTLDAHYTSETVVRAMWSAVARLGFKGGLALESSMGSGNFLGMIPQEFAGSTRFVGVEYDATTARVAEALYPQETVLHAGFHKVPVPDNTFALNIGNPPFGPQSLTFQFKPELAGVSIHNQFFRAAMDALRPGGVQALVVSRFLLDAQDKGTRLALAKQARLLGAIRLPDTAFKENARTEVVTDIIFLQKLTEAEQNEMAEAVTAYQARPEKNAADERERRKATDKVPAWVETGAVADPLGGEQITLNQYFKDNPRQILGVLERSGSMQHGADVTVRLDDKNALAGMLADAIARLPENVMNVPDEVPANTQARFKSLSDSLRIQLNKEEPGHLKIDLDGKLQRVLERETPEGDYEFMRQEINADSPWSEQLYLDAQGRWYRLDVALDEKGEKKKIVKNGKVTKLNEYERMVFQNEADIPATLRLGEDRLGRLTQLVRLRDYIKRQLTLEAEDKPESVLEASRKSLRSAYEAFVKAHGPVNRPANAALVGNMPDGGLVLASELNYKPAVSKEQAAKSGLDPREESVTPAPIMARRVVPKYEPPTKADSAADALIISLSERGRVDLERMASLVSKTEAEIIEELQAGDKPLIFKDPESGQWETSNAYLSGNVRKKLIAAKSADIPMNVKALEAVQPAPWTADQVTVMLGSAWVPPAIYAEFYEHITGGKAKASYSRATNTFSLGISEQGPQAGNWSSQGAPAQYILSRLLNSQPVLVMTPGTRDEGPKVDQEATAIAQLKAREMVDEFGDWVFRDAARRANLTEIFNDRYNTRVTRQHDGSHLTLPGKVPDGIISMRRHQKNAIWRGIAERFMLIDHAVGAGKTFTGIARAIERRRMGLSKKPMIVVPNHLVEQWAADVYRLYPGAKVLAASSKDFDVKRRRRLFAKIATGDWDIVIVPHSSFAFIGVAPETEERFLREELRIAMEAVEEAEQQAIEDGTAGGRGKPFGVKEAERLVEKIQGRLDKLGTKKDRLLTFEQMGVDDLTVDEAHEFKNLFYSSRLTGVRGMGNKTGSQKAFDLYNKVRVLRESPTGSVTFMTGTPISNSAVEMFTMLRYLAADELRDMGMEHFDAWRAQFVEATSKFEPTESGRLKEVTRLGRSWSNMRSLMDLYYGVTDAVTNEDIQKWYREDKGVEFPIPKVKGGERQLVAMKPTEAQLGLLEQVMSAFDSLPGIQDPYERNKQRLRLMNVARSVSLDVRSIGRDKLQAAGISTEYGASPEKGGKLERVSEEIKRIYDKWTPDLGTQLVFLDRSVPKSKGDDKIIKAYDALQAKAADALDKGDEEAYSAVLEALEKYDANEIAELRAAQAGGWNAYQQLKDNLVAQGIPAAQIRFVQEADDDAKKKALFDAVNGGKVRVLIGSTPRMGAGTNVQQRLVGLHHVDVTWKPSDIEQREGRIIRQPSSDSFSLMEKYGPSHEVEIFAYATERTVDAKMWDLNATKLKMINGIRKYDGAFTMEFEDEDSVSMAEMAALASGDPMLLERVTLESQISTLELQERGFRRNQYSVEDQVRAAEKAIREGPSTIQTYKERAALTKPAVQALAEAANGRKVTIEGKTFNTQFSAAAAATEAIKIAKGDDENKRYSINVNGVGLTNKDDIADAIIDSLGDVEPFQMTVRGATYIRRTPAAKAITELVNEARKKQGDGETIKLGEVAGLELAADLKVGEKYDDVTLVLRKDGQTLAQGYGNPEVKRTQFTAGSIRGRIEKLLESLEQTARGTGDWAKERMEQAERDLPGLRERMGQKFPKAEEIEEKRRRLAEVIGTLSGAKPKAALAPDLTAETEFGLGNIRQTGAFEGNTTDVAFMRGDPQTETKAFKEWFGDSVVTESGEAGGVPKVMYHGTYGDFDSFKRRTGDIGLHFGDAATASDRIAYGVPHRGNKDGKTLSANVMPVYLSIKNPIRLEDAGFWNPENMGSTLDKMFPKPAWVKGNRFKTTKDIREFLQSKGYDGVVYKNTGEVGGSEPFRERIAKAREAMAKVFPKGKNGFDLNDQQVPEYKEWSEAQTAYRLHRENAGTDSYIAFERTQIKSAIGNRGTFDPKDPDIRFLRGDPAPRGAKVVAVQQFMDSITEKWSNAPTVIVAANMEDQLVPKAVRDYNASQMAKDAAGAPMGFFYGGKVYVLADSLNSPQDALTVLAHEALGHYGLRGMFGDRLDGIKGQIIAMRKKEVLAKVKAYGLDPAKREDLMYAAEEVLAEMAQTVPSLGFVKRAVAIVRQWLRENIPGFGKMELTDDEIINQYIVPARGWVVRGRDSGTVEPALAFMRDGKPVLWRSSLRDGLAEAKMQGGRADGWKAAIQGLINKGAVKEDEVEWSGIREWLDLQTGKVSKEDVLAYLDANGVQVQEVVLGGSKPEQEDMLTADDIRVEPEGDQGRWFIEAPTGSVTARAGTEEEAIAFGVRYFNSQIAERNRNAARDADNTKYSQYTLPGGENYREVLLTLPSKNNDVPSIVAHPKYADQFALQFPSGEYVTSTDGGRTTERTTNPDKATNWETQEYAKYGVKAHDKRSDIYKSSHWDATNVLAHIRLNDRTDADGNRVLFVEELQSDWGQEGKKKGFNTKVTPEQVAREVYGRDLAELDAAEREGVMIETEGRNEGTGGAAGTRSGVVPVAPFVTSTDKWLTLALKRIVVMAAQEGYDKVAFVTGEQSAERYSLDKHVGRVTYTPSMNGGTLVATDKGDNSFVISETNVTPEKLADFVGKDVAEKLMAEPLKDGSHMLRGDDLKVPQGGMRQFYDKIVPTAANKLLAKLGGGKVEAVRVNQTDGFAGNERKAPAKGISSDQLGFTITPAMREKASAGLPMFSRQLAKFSRGAQKQANNAVQSTVDKLTADWQNKPEIVIAFDMQDEAIPDNVRLEDAKQRSGGAFGNPEGFYYRGVVYLLSSQLATDADIARVLAHESLGHYGLRGLYGKALKPILQQIATMRRADVIAVARQRGLVKVDGNNRPIVDVKTATNAQVWAAMTDSHKSQSAEEVLAEMAQTTPQAGFVKRAVAAIRQWLREHGVNLKLTDNDIIVNYILPARGWVERGPGGGGPKGGVSFARGAKSGDAENTRYTRQWYDRLVGLLPDSYRNDPYRREPLPAESGNAQQAREVQSKIDALNKQIRGPRDTKGHGPVTSDELGNLRVDAREATYSEIIGEIKDLADDIGYGVVATGVQIRLIEKFKNAGFESEISLAAIADRLTGARDAISDEKSVYAVQALGTIMSYKPRGFPMALFSRSDQTQTEAFKRWFAGSKVVDAEGRPLVVYHGTTADLSAFDLAFSGSDGVAYDRPAIFATDDARVASDYARNKFNRRIADAGRAFQRYKNENPGDYGEEYEKLFQAYRVAGQKEGWDAGAGANVLPLYLSIQNPLEVDGRGERFMQVLPDAVKRATDLGHDGVIARNVIDHASPVSEYPVTVYIAFDPEQVKSATGNRGTFDPKDPDIRFSRGAAGNVLNANTLRTQATERVSDFFAGMKAPGKLNWWHKTVGTQYNLAQRYPRFKRVFDAAQNFLNDVSLYATEAADLAPKILPKLETWRDIAKSPISAEDNKAIAAPIFEGTLKWTRVDGDLVETDDVATAGVVWSDAELESRYNLTPQQIGLYREFRAAVDKSLTNLAISDMVRFAGRDAAPIRSVVMGSSTVAEAERTLVDYLQSVADSDAERAEVLESTIAAVQKKAERAGDLMRRGYAPLSRFGQYTLDVIDNGERVYFGLFESAAEAAKMARRMRANFPGAEIARGTVSQEEYKLFAGVSPETVELFGDLLGLEAQGDSEADKAFQTYIKVAKANRSSMKRLITRKGMAGFSEDAGRVLAGFVYSNARQTSQNLHMGELTEAAMAVNEGDARGDGELKDRAAKLVEYVKNPVEEAQAFRSLLFVQYLGGSVASALVNMTQPIQVTLPYLSQFGGPAKAAGQMRKALADVWKNTTGDARLDAALKRAEEEGIVAPQEVHQLMAQAQGKGSLQSGDGTVLGDASAKASNALSKLALGWGKFFGAAEQFNRRVTFIAAYRTAVDQGIARPADFAEKALAETQFLYNKGNKPQWARGAVGSTLFVFKQYSISYVELMNRMWQSGPEGKKAVLLAMGLLFLVGGAGGLPFVEDAEDLLDAMMQRLGYNYSTKLARRQFFERVVGKEAARFMERGISGLPGAPLDVSGRLGMGNLIPGTGLLVQKQDSTRDVTELAGPAGDFIGRLFKGANQALQGEVGQAAVTVFPAAARNAAKAVDMYATGIYKDERGRKVLDVDAYDAAIKFIGFQPNDVARVQQASQTAQKLISQVKVAEAAIADRWAKALAEGDADGVKAAREELRDWNRKNPETPMRIAPGQINKRVKAMRQDKATRLEKTAPREIRNTVREELRPA